MGMQRAVMTVGIVGTIVITVTARPHGRGPEAPAQEAAPLSFESSIVRENHVTREQNERFGMAIDEGGRFRATFVTLRELITAAHDVRAGRIVDGPEWIRSDRFDIVAHAPGNFDPEQTHAMMRGLLEDRFSLAVRREKRRTPTYSLVWADGRRRPGRGIRAPAPCRDRAGATSTGQVPRPSAPAADDCRSSSGFGTGRLSVRRGPVSALLPLLGAAVGREVFDKSGLRGTYDIDVTWTTSADAGFPFAPPGGPDADSLASIFTAVREQLGLKLEPAIEELEVLAIQRVERPTPD
jgi:uncharacterized protein (TIGR03435 family)